MNELKQVMPKSEELSRSLEIKPIGTFDTEFPTIFNKSCTYITFKSAVKHIQLGYGYPISALMKFGQCSVLRNSILFSCHGISSDFMSDNNLQLGQ